MKCYTHKDTDAVAVCVHCGRAMCSSCATPSGSGRFVCSPACAAASRQFEHFVASNWRRTAHSYRILSYGLYLIAVVFAVSGILFATQTHDWRELLYLEACAVVFAVGGFFIRRLTKHYSEQPNTALEPTPTAP
jgi:hypothetical protein